MKRPDWNTPLNLTEEYKAKVSLIVSVITLLVLCLFLRQLDKILIQAPKEAQEEQQQKEEEQKELTETQPDVYTADFLAVGDNRFSNSLISSGYNEANNTYNFDDIYSPMKSLIDEADFSIVNQETVFTADSDSYSGEDIFATPVEVGDTLVSAGFDGIASATDHMDDFGASMITETLDFWKNYSNVRLLGIHASQTDAGSITTVEINQIKVALLNYTSSSYTDQLSEENSYMIDSLEQSKVSADIAAVKDSSDCIIVIANWGEENASEVSEEQKEWANFFLSEGVAVTIGMNPREIQPMETLTDVSGNSMLVYYSLGNFVSTQSEIPRLLGAMAKFTIEKTVPQDPTQPASVRIRSFSLEPTVMHYNYEENFYAVYPLSSYTEDLAASHSIHDSTEEDFTLAGLQSLFAERTGASASVEDTDTNDDTDTSDENSDYDESSEDSDNGYDDYDNGYDDYDNSYDDYDNGYDDYDSSYDDYDNGYDDYDNGYDDYDNGEGY